MTVALVLLIVLLFATNVVTVRLLIRRMTAPGGGERVDPVIAEALDRVAQPGVASPRPRRVITVEVRNPIELAAARGRVVGVAGALAPGLVTRLVHEQTVKTLRRELSAQGVLADVRLHTLLPPSADNDVLELPATDESA